MLLLQFLHLTNPYFLLTAGFGGYTVEKMTGRAMKKKFIVGTVSLILLTGCTGSMPDLGINNGELTPCPKTPNCVNSQAISEKNYIRPIRYAGTQQEARARLLQILESEKRTKILTAKKNYIRAEFKSALFRFIDDVEFYFPKKQTGEVIIHIRSASRIGYSDLGANRKRIERIRSKF
ncbi:DUF1499 domain-containing protein [Desulfobacula toluolica]|uniref:DUF1499 domain-containing protein n=1 Tax=Desulfobacula toluolica TaxID=28223 RepID=UPI001E6137FD|nr:DUF1499 domain-containing protein [Desulfobacula toluolica]